MPLAAPGTGQREQFRTVDCGRTERASGVPLGSSASRLMSCAQPAAVSTSTHASGCAPARRRAGRSHDAAKAGQLTVSTVSPSRSLQRRQIPAAVASEAGSLPWPTAMVTAEESSIKAISASSAGSVRAPAVAQSSGDTGGAFASIGSCAVTTCRRVSQRLPEQPDPRAPCRIGDRHVSRLIAPWRLPHARAAIARACRTPTGRTARHVNRGQ